MKKKALFYEDAYYLLSNFSAHQVFVFDQLYPTSEHAYQAAKFLKSESKIAEEIKDARSPLEAKNIAYMGDNPDKIREDWDEVKVEIMEKIVEAKFLQHSEVQEVLKATEGLEIAENSPVDYFWGIGKDGSGKNELGKIWMRIRDKHLS